MSAQRLEDTPPSDGQVTFRWGAYTPDTDIRERDRPETLPIDEFLRRSLQHVPPSGDRTVRHYGLSTSAKHDAYARCRDLFSDREPASLPASPDDDAPDTDGLETTAAHLPRLRQPLMVSSSLPSGLMGKLIPRVPLGHIFVPSASPGGGHDP